MKNEWNGREMERAHPVPGTPLFTEPKLTRVEKWQCLSVFT